ncbi:MAG: ABC transporter substrate-binding protein, partial [Rhodospirillales bacterium]|nr:ABC transporter substrate-binding protein [Rhodospirillales bacterium]
IRDPSVMKHTDGWYYVAYTTGWTGDSGDPDNFLHLLLSCDAIASGTNRARWCHAPYDALITEAGRAADFGYRAELYRRAQVIAREQAPIVPIAHSVVAVAVRREVQNFRIGPTGQHMFHAVELR